MRRVQHGCVAVEIPEEIALPERSGKIARVMQDLTVVVLQLSQARLLFDHDTFDKLRYLKDLVSPYAKYNPELRVVFAPLFERFGRSAKTRQERQRKKVRLEKEKATPTLTLVAETPDALEVSLG